MSSASPGTQKEVISGLAHHVESGTADGHRLFLAAVFPVLVQVDGKSCNGLRGIAHRAYTAVICMADRSFTFFRRYCRKEKAVGTAGGTLLLRAYP